ncbi:hypothetical protein Mgra_00005730 [Meloidogyne graminicola]|uniref:Isoleucine--tRNA ligase, cytoplasmic n=1 Tax=Meloidogyne graminicola TaxID=189291 RepID=A0A8S9ZP27_9BILA|nr:hypothetical protein Mgra_00005730 [Meloidogyne graminicola]
MKPKEDVSRLEIVNEHIDFAEEERKILQKWRDKNTFQSSLDRNRGKPHYTFYDGPPFATGLPHYGHILAGTIKDIVTRWAHQSGFYVERRFGWDTHGLPVEYEVDKILGIKGPSDVLDMGIASYNAKCRSIVMRYAEEWQHTVERTGRWIDFDNDYKTLYPWFMETVWWVFSQLFKKNLVYRGVKVMPFSIGCSTPLSNFEAGQNYQDVVDPSVFVAFPLVENPNRSFVAWTTTPWTLPSNMALCVNPNLVYVVISDNKTQKEYIILKERLSELYKSPNAYKIVETFKGNELAGKEYTPPFPYFLGLKENGRKLFCVLTNTYVKTDQGTGIVHQAPYFGEEDHKTCLEHGVISKESEMVCPVDEKGIFTDEVTDFKGLYVKDADKQIIKMLKEKGILLKQEQYKHSYPFCYRSNTPLIYKAVPSWFIRVESFIDQLLANNEKTKWVPSFVRDKRFANWLRDARDWAVSRNRFWGTPINLWVSDDHNEIICPGSIAELEELTGVKVTDLHRENIDDITIPSKIEGNKPLRRVSEVFDCWFESGSMPYAQQHYPFENSEVFENNFPADFVAEGIDQTRGWFYTLLVISTALFNRPPFKNLICNGLVLASDGNKMSKSKKNYPDPMEIVEKYGADALRLYLINSPVVRGENLRFQEEGVAEVVKQVLGPWLNAYKFVSLAINKYETDSGKQFVLYSKGFTNLMDKWILSFTNSLISFVSKEMKEYRLYTVVSPLVNYFDILTNTFIRLNRSRIKGTATKIEDKGEDQLFAISTLIHVILQITRLMAPFTPFFSEYMWQKLKNTDLQAEDSVHFTSLPTAEDNFIDENLERQVATMRSIIEIIRTLRDRKSYCLKYPLKEVIVVNRDLQFLEDVVLLKDYILSEMNVIKLTTSNNRQDYGVNLKAEPNFRLLGARLKSDQKVVADYLKNKISENELEQFLDDGKITVLGHLLSSEELSVSFTINKEKNEEDNDNQWETATKVINTSEDENILAMGLCREIANRIQKLRKKGKLLETDKAIVYCFVKPKDSLLAKALNDNYKNIEQSTGTPLMIEEEENKLKNVLMIAESCDQIKGAELEVFFFLKIIFI